MQIQQSIQNSLGTVSHIPTQVLAKLVVGQQIEAAVVKAALAAQIVSLRVGETLIDVRTPVPLQQGQKVQLELIQSGEKPALKLIPPAELVSSTPRTTTAQPVALVPGQQLAVEVIKLLGENRLLVETAQRNPSVGTTAASRPLQFDIDIAKLAKTFTAGEKLVVEVSTVKPLTVALKAEPLLREQLVVDRIKQLLPQLESKPSLASVNSALKTLSLPSTVQGEVARLTSHILDKQFINQPQALKQAIQSSGVFTEKTLLKQPHFIGGDFKANLLKIASVLEADLGRKTNALNQPLAQSSNVQQKTSPLQTLSATSLGKSQVATAPSSSVIARNQIPTPANQTISAMPQTQLQTHSVQLKNDQQQNVTLRSPFAFQTQATKNAESAVGQTKIDSGGIKGQDLPSQTVVTQTNTASAATPKLTLLSTILQALGAYNATPSSVSVLSALPSSTGLPTALPPFLESILTPSQASALVQALNKSIAGEPVRMGGQLDVLLLQGLLKEVESLHARIQLNQFSMIKEPESPSAPIASWLIDLPLKDKQAIEFVQLQIDQFKEQRNEEEEEDDIWNVQLRLDTQNLGPLQATVTMHVDDIKIVLRAERAESAVLLEENLPWLQNALARLGVSVSHMSCSCGEVAKPTLAEQYLAETTSLVDVSV